MAEIISAKEVKTRHRSPAYPAVGLREAVTRADKFYKTDRKAGAPAEIAVKHMGFATAHGQAMSVLAALKKFGLVAESSGRIVPTQRAIEIIELPADDPRRLKALRDAALSPVIYRELIEKHRETGWPADDVLEAELVTYKNFNSNSVEGFVKDLRDTLDFAGLTDISVIESLAGEAESMPGTTKETVGASFVKEMERGATPGQALSKIGDRMRGAPLLTQALVISIPRDFKVDISVRGDELKKEDLVKIKNQFNRWIEGLEEAFEE
jgi:hypothetical protein